MALYCPDPANHHLHVPPPFLHDGHRAERALRDAVAAEIQGGNWSIRGLRAAYGVDRSYVRLLLWELVPQYMADYAARHGPQRVTNHDHQGNRRRRRKR
jgi:hypothetical protein